MVVLNLLFSEMLLVVFFRVGKVNYILQVHLVRLLIVLDYFVDSELLLWVQVETRRFECHDLYLEHRLAKLLDRKPLLYV